MVFILLYVFGFAVFVRCAYVDLDSAFCGPAKKKADKLRLSAKRICMAPRAIKQTLIALRKNDSRTNLLCQTKETHARLCALSATAPFFDPSADERLDRIKYSLRDAPLSRFSI